MRPGSSIVSETLTDFGLFPEFGAITRLVPWYRPTASACGFTATITGAGTVPAGVEPIPGVMLSQGGRAVVSMLQLSAPTPLLLIPNVCGGGTGPSAGTLKSKPLWVS